MGLLSVEETTKFNNTRTLNKKSKGGVVIVFITGFVVVYFMAKCKKFQHLSCKNIMYSMLKTYTRL